jgi:HD-GYP domain-containing protein (c-di-GMP phosphodiesterase class II)
MATPETNETKKIRELQKRLADLTKDFEDAVSIKDTKKSIGTIAAFSKGLTERVARRTRNTLHAIGDGFDNIKRDGEMRDMNQRLNAIASHAEETEALVKSIVERTGMSERDIREAINASHKTDNGIETKKEK